MQFLRESDGGSGDALFGLLSTIADAHKSRGKEEDGK